MYLYVIINKQTKKQIMKIIQTSLVAELKRLKAELAFSGIEDTAKFARIEELEMNMNKETADLYYTGNI